ncbi:MAG TPA: hypothetical protein VGJ44_12305 [Kribbellaceae bacterium]
MWDAELTGTITTTAGSVGLRAFVHGTDDLLVVVLDPDAGEQSVTWSFTPYPAVSPRARTNTPPAGYQLNPDPALTVDGGGGECVQNLVAGGQTTTAWRSRSDDDGTSMLVATVAHSYPDATAQAQAERTVENGIGAPLPSLVAAHQHWWHEFYPRSFVSFADARLQSFYWIQLYKMASATRAGRPVIGTCAEWLEPTSWPATWWNLNVQLEYWLIHATRHPELDSVSRSLDLYRDNLTLNVPDAYRGRLGGDRPHHAGGSAQRGRRCARHDQHGRPARDRQPHLGAARRMAGLPAHDGRRPVARRDLSLAAPGGQLLPALPDRGC